MPGFKIWLNTPIGHVAQISTDMTLADHLGSWKVRWGIGRSRFIVPPGLYAVGRPDEDSPVIVTANYKMSYDIVRSNLKNHNVWLLVLETYGINVWCAAGKGTFGTKELIHRIQQSGLSQVVQHKRLILPILGAPGIAAHVVTKRTGFSIHYATLRAEDLPEYLDSGLKTTARMKELSFSLRERAILIPVDAVQKMQATLPILVLLFLCGWGINNLNTGISASLAYLGAVLTGTVLAPLLLPLIPGKSFALKGVQLGLLWSVTWYLYAGHELRAPEILGSLLVFTSISAWCAFGFTGSTPFTSLSGVRKELRIALPASAAGFISGSLLWAWTILTSL